MMMKTNSNHSGTEGLNHAHRSMPLSDKVYAVGQPIKFKYNSTSYPVEAIVRSSDNLTLAVDYSDVSGDVFGARIFKSMVVS